MAKKEKKTNKENKHFFKDFKAEIKKVIWPTSKQLTNTTIAIIAMVLIVGIIVFGLDVAFDAMNKYGLTKLQETVQNIDNEDNNEESDDSENTEATEESENNDEAVEVEESTDNTSAE